MHVAIRAAEKFRTMERGASKRALGKRICKEKENGIQTYELDELDLLARYFSSDPYCRDKLH